MADSPIRRLYLLALIDATKHPQIYGHPTICQTAEQIAPVLTREMMATPTISLAMMSPDADSRGRRQPRHERSPRGLAETPGGSGVEGVAGGAAGGKVAALTAPCRDWERFAHFNKIGRI
jgi:hypothetical protein